MADEDLSPMGPLLDKGVEQRQLAKRVQVPAVCTEVEYVDDNLRGHVYHKFDPDIDAEDIPFVALWGGDGHGHEPAIELPVDGTLLALDYPLVDIIAESGVRPDAVDRRRHRAFQDGLFVAGLKADDVSGLGSPLLADWYRHPSGTERRISPAGDWTVEHHAGHTVHVGTNGIEATYHRTDGTTVEVRMDETEAQITVPNTHPSADAGATSTVGLGTDGTGSVDTYATLGDADAERINPTQTGNTHSGYAETGTPNAPLADPSTTTEINSPAALAAGPLDMLGYEVRNNPVPRREADPDPAVTDITSPAYFPAPEVPLGYLYVETTASVLRIWGSANAPVDIMAI